MRAGKNGAMKFFLFSILITTSIVLFKKANVFEKIKELNPPRNLFSDTEKDYAKKQVLDLLINIQVITMRKQGMLKKV